MNLNETKLIEMLDEKSLDVLGKLVDVKQIKRKIETDRMLAVVIGKIKKNYVKLNQEDISKVCTFCFIGKNNSNNSRIIVRPFRQKINELIKYVSNNPNFR